MIVVARKPSSRRASTWRDRQKVLWTVEAKLGDGKPFKDALIMFALVDDPTQSFTVSENEAGAYASAVQLPGKSSSWREATATSPARPSTCSRMRSAR